MFKDLFVWSLKVSLILALVYGGYWLLFKTNTQFQLRRSIVLLILVLAVLTPFMRIEIRIPSVKQVTQVSETIPMLFPKSHNTVTVSSQAPSTPDTTGSSAFGWREVLTYTYLTGAIISFLMLVIEMSKLSIWYFLGVRRTDIQNNVITHRGIKYPFSFWKWIFVPQGTDYDKETWEIIEEHESTHLRQGHSVDMIMTGIIQCLLWYNPIIYILQKELRENHEALADQSVLHITDLNTYAKALLSVSIETNNIRLGHSFALTSGLTKRLKAMKQERTKSSKTISSTLLMTFLLIAVTAVNVLKAQDKKEETREEALKTVKDRNLRSIALPFMILNNKLTQKHQNVLDRLMENYPDMLIRFRYFENPNGFEYDMMQMNNQKPLYIGQITESEKMELRQLIANDSMRLKDMVFLSSPDSKFRFSLDEVFEETSQKLLSGTNYIVFYEPDLEDRDEKIYELSEVDKAPEPIGGLEAFERAIALDVELPNNVNKTDLPESIDYEVVVNGGPILAHINLITELKGSDKKNKDKYLFFGELLKSIQDKSRQFYSWKRGFKDGKEVRVRMTVSIPTRYMSQ